MKLHLISSASKNIIILLSFFSAFNSHADSKQVFDITVEKPTFVLPQFSAIHSQREVSVALEEVESAVRLKELLDSGKKQAVLAELDKFYDLELSPAMLMLKAQVYFSLNEYQKAEDTYMAVLKRTPQLVRAHSDLGQLYLIREDFAAARKYFANAVAYGSNEAIIHGQLAYLNLTLHGAISAISEYQQALALEPENPQWQQGLLAALSQSKMYEATQAYIKELIQKRPDDPQIWLNQATIALQMDNKELALASLEMAILLGDDGDGNLKTAAQLHLQLKSHDRAIELMEKSLAKGQLDQQSVFDYVNWLVQANRYDQAEKLLKLFAPKIEKLSADDQAIYYLHFARIIAHKKDYAQAAAYYKNALERNPLLGDALLSYAEFLVFHKDYVQAEFYYLRAEALQDFEKKAMLGRAQMFIDSQGYASALSVLRSVYKKYPAMSELQGTMLTLENIIQNKSTLVN